MNNKYTSCYAIRLMIIAILALLLPSGKLAAQPAAQYIFSAFSGTYANITGTPANILADDLNSTGIPLGFTFGFAGTNYTQVSISSNGWINFTNTNPAAGTSRTNTTGNAGIIGPMVMPLWDDLSGQTGTPATESFYTTTGIAPNRTFALECRDWRWDYQGTTGCISYQVKLYESSNIIDFIYNQGAATTAGGPSATIGIYNSGADFQTLPDVSANPIPSTVTFTTNIFSKPASGQVYRWSPQSLSPSFVGTNFCGGTGMNVDYTALGLLFSPGNTFTVELSDPVGSFATPQVIGALASTTSTGTIPVTFPANQAAGTGYRIRIVSSNTAYTGIDNGVDLTINPEVLPTVNITVSPDTAICINTPATFTANITNGGGSPNYQWYKNNNPVGTNSASYTDNTLADGDIVHVVLTSNAVCANPTTVTSNTITMSVAFPSTPSVMVYAVPGDTICPGTPVAFHTITANAGNSPTFQWTKNGNPVGTNSPDYSDLLLVDGDLVQVTMTSNQACVTPQTVQSNIMTTKIIYSNVLAGVVSYPTTKQVIMAGNKYTVTDDDCKLIATVDPVGTNPINGLTYVSVSLTYAENTYNGQPYIKRHFDIYPDVGEETATAMLTIYAYQSEFSSYNILADGWGFPPLPRDSADVANFGNVRITQFHGIGNVPANYPGPVETYMPTSVSWDPTYHWWVITFPVNGFSGFYVHTSNFDNPLNVTNTPGNDFAVHAHPNPVENMLTVTVNGNRTGESYISLTDVTGKLIQKVKVTGSNTDMDMSSLATGLYLVKYNDDVRSETIKVTKQ